MAQDVIRRIREVTDKPIKYVVLTPLPRGARAGRQRPTSPQHIIASQDTYDLIVERGEQDKASEIGRFPRLFRNVETRAAGPDLADHDLHRQDDAVARQARSAAAAARPRPHQGRHGRLAAEQKIAASRATWSSSTPRPTPATPTSRTGRRRSTTLAALEPEALVPGRGAALDHAGRRWPRASTARAASSPTSTPACKSGVAAGKDLNAVYKDTYAKLQARSTATG